MSGVSVIVDGKTGQAARVNEDGQLSTFSQTVSNSLAASIKGDRYNISGELFVTLTDDAPTPVLYIQNNEPESVGWALTQLVVVAGASAGGTGEYSVSFHSNPTSGTIITGGIDALIVSQNLGSQKPLEATAKIGGTGDTIQGGISISRLIPVNPVVFDLPLDAVIMPPGTSIAIGVNPPLGNTSMIVDVSVGLLRLEA